MIKNNFNFTYKEWRLILILSFLMIIITGIPILLGYLFAEPGTIYLGLHSLSPADNPVYYSYIRQASEGNIFFYNFFTHEAQSHGIFNIVWLVVGWFAKIFSLSAILAFHLFRLILIPIILIIVYKFVSLFFDNYEQRRLTIIFLLFASGLGVYFAPFITELGYDLFTTWWPIDLWIPESYLFSSIYKSPHFILSLIFTLSIFILYIKAIEKNKLMYIVLAGLMALVYFNFHPYYAPVIYGTLFLFTIYNILKKSHSFIKYLSYFLILFIVSLPSVYYHWWLVSNDYIIAQRALQNITPLSPWPFVFIGYGLLILGFLVGLWYFIKNKKYNSRYILLLAWFFVNILLIILPIQFESRYTQGLQFVFVLFLVFSIPWLSEYWKKKINNKSIKSVLFDNYLLNIILFIIFFGMTPIFLIVRDVYYHIEKPDQIEKMFYIKGNIYQGLEWLESQPQGKTVMSSEHLASFIPSFTGQKVYLGHKHETIFYSEKKLKTQAVYNDKTSSTLRYKILKDNNIDFLLFSEYEEWIGNFQPNKEEYLELVYQNQDISIYQIN